MRSSRDHSATSNLVRGGLYVFSANSATILLGVASGVLAARLLLPEGRGALAAALFWPHFAAGIGSLSLNEAVAHEISKRGGDSGEIAAGAFWCALGLAALTIAAVYPLLGPLLGAERTATADLARGYLLLFIPASYVSMALIAVDQGSFRFARHSLFSLVQPSIYLLGILWLWWRGDVSVPNMAIAVLLGAVLAALLRFAVCGRGVMRVPGRVFVARLLRTGARFHASNLLLFANQEADKLLVLLLASDAALGEYVVALTFAATLLGVVSRSFSTVMFPHVSAADDPVTTATAIAAGLRYSLLALVGCNLVLAALAPGLIPWLFGDAYAGAVPVAIVLLFAQVPKGLRSVIAYSFKAAGRPRESVKGELVALVVLVVAMAPAYAAMGLVGIALALLASNTASLLYLGRRLRACLGIHWSDWLRLDGALLREALRKARQVAA